MGCSESALSGYANGGLNTALIEDRWDNEFAVSSAVDGLFGGIAGSSTGAIRSLTNPGQFALGFSLGLIYGGIRGFHGNQIRNDSRNVILNINCEYKTNTGCSKSAD